MSALALQISAALDNIQLPAVQYITWHCSFSLAWFSLVILHEDSKGQCECRLPKLIREFYATLCIKPHYGMDACAQLRLGLTFNSLMCTNWTTLYSLAQTESCLRDTSQSMAYLTDWSEKILTIMSCDGLRCLRRLHRTLFSTPVLVNGLAITILNWWMEWLVSSEHFHIHTLRQLQTGGCILRLKSHHCQSD